MNRSHARTKILNRIAEALSAPTGIPFPNGDGFSFDAQDQENLAAKFVKEFVMLEGKVFRCKGKEELFEKLKMLGEQKQWVNVNCQTTTFLKDFRLELLPFINKETLSEVDAGITDCECLVARTGTVVLSAKQPSGRLLPVSVPVHVVIANEDQLVFNISDAMDSLRKKYPDRLPSALFFASGPSRTGDIERKLVVGVHGPKEVYLFLMNGNSKAKVNQLSC